MASTSSLRPASSTTLYRILPRFAHGHDRSLAWQAADAFDRTKQFANGRECVISGPRLACRQLVNAHSRKAKNKNYSFCLTAWLRAGEQILTKSLTHGKNQLIRAIGVLVHTLET